jgi:hypothetical protein
LGGTGGEWTRRALGDAHLQSRRHQVANRERRQGAVLAEIRAQQGAGGLDAGVIEHRPQ